MGNESTSRKILAEFKREFPRISKDKLRDVNSLVSYLESNYEMVNFNQYSLDDDILTQFCYYENGDIKHLPIFFFNVTNQFHLIFERQVSNCSRLVRTFRDKSLKLLKDIEKDYIILFPLVSELERNKSDKFNYTVTTFGLTIRGVNGIFISYKFKYSKLVDEVESMILKIKDIINFVNLEIEQKQMKIGLTYA